MGHTPVTHKLDSDVKVLQDGLMATLDDACHKLGGAGVGDFVLRLVADPPAQLNVLEDGLAIQRGEDFGIGVNDFLVSRSSSGKWCFVTVMWKSSISLAHLQLPLPLSHSQISGKPPIPSKRLAMVGSSAAQRLRRVNTYAQGGSAMLLPNAL